MAKSGSIGNDNRKRKGDYMPTAKNMKQLNQMLMKNLQKALDEANRKILEDMCEETEDFYTGGTPVKYQRTGALGDTPRTTAVSSKTTSNGGSASFDAYLDTSEQYTTGKRPSMKTVLTLANKGSDMTNPPMRAVVGKPGFWDRARDKMEDRLKDAISHFFG